MNLPLAAGQDRVYEWPVTVAANGNPGGTSPLFVLSPVTKDGRPTVGFCLALFAPAVGAVTVPAAGLTIAPYRYIPTVGLWAAMDVYTGYQLNQQLVCFDLAGAQGFYFDIYNASIAGNVEIVFGELG